MNDDSSEDGRPDQRRGVSGVDEDRALDALTLAWGDEYDEIWVHDGEWGAHHKDAGDDDNVTGATPDELNRAMRANCARRLPDPTVEELREIFFREHGGTR